MEVVAKSIEHNPSEEVLRKYAENQPIARISEFGNVNVTTVVTARQKVSTFIVSDEPEKHTDQTITRAAYEKLVEAQEAHMAQQDVIVLDGYIGDHPDARVASRLIVEKSNANLAGMQRLLYFPPDADHEPEFTIIYSPTLLAPGYPNDRVIAVDLDNSITRVLNSDYLGESKMGGLRMWDALMYRRGGLAMHCGLKSIEVGGNRKVVLIVGLSGTGKTTTTFSRQGDATFAVQDDFVALFPEGRVYGTEAGTFAKVYGMTPESEPAIWTGTTSPRTYLENVAQDDSGKLDFFDKSHTENSRAIISSSDIPGMIPPREVDKADYLLILNRNQGIVPAVSKLNREQAAAYFMLGETQGTSAGGADEEGKSLRVPGTNPFFCYRHELQANRLYELMGTTDLDVFLLNTGRVGGANGEGLSRKVTPRQTGAILEAIVAGTIQWEVDPDFGYQVATEVPGIKDHGILQPRTLYAEQGRSAEHEARVEQLKAERREHLAKYELLLPEIASAV